MPSMSPMPNQTPINFNYASSTPIGISHVSPIYQPSSIRGTSSNLRSPSYLYQGSSSSPNYSSSLRSHSPDYNNSPMNSSNRVNNSPNYTPTPADSH